MNSPREQFEALAPLFTYPRENYPEYLDNAMKVCSSTAPALLEFGKQIPRMSLDELQELYTSTFDLRPVCPLDVGWHLFGDEYDRGLLLSYMRRQLKAHGIPEAGELPDHISRALLLLARMNPAKAQEFAGAIIAPALKRMLKCMPARNAFTHLLRASQELLAISYPAAFEPTRAVAEGVAS